MNAITVTQAEKGLEQLISNVISNADPTIICDDKGQKAVLISYDEFSSWQETLYLLSNPANAKHLRKSISEAETGKTAERILADI
ncbi:type II toxin-antitoxin system Phd/YefM family antitoxin [Desulfobacterales bacterium HSG17]|nr:type II toxin-antitoxin system Phd/YefM family antitoxin [Desulfobacterales bacterium HSG17]